MRDDETGGPWGDGWWTAAGSSMLRLSLALTVLGARQAAHLFERTDAKANESGRDARPRTTSPIDAVLNGVEEQLDGVSRGVYRVGREYLEGAGKSGR